MRKAYVMLPHIRLMCSRQFSELFRNPEFVVQNYIIFFRKSYFLAYAPMRYNADNHRILYPFSSKNTSDCFSKKNG